MCSLNASNEHEVVELGRAAGIVGEASQWIGLFLELLSVAAKLEKITSQTWKYQMIYYMVAAELHSFDFSAS